MSEMRLYRPSNGSEGDDFMERFCFRCERDRYEDCEIISRSMAFKVTEPEYPTEWQYVDGHPTCTAFLAKRTPQTGEEAGE